VSGIELSVDLNDKSLNYIQIMLIYSVQLPPTRQYSV
jgi:hypothetical protein